MIELSAFMAFDAEIRFELEIAFDERIEFEPLIAFALLIELSPLIRFDALIEFDARITFELLIELPGKREKFRNQLKLSKTNCSDRSELTCAYPVVVSDVIVKADLIVGAQTVRVAGWSWTVSFGAVRI